MKECYWDGAESYGGGGGCGGGGGIGGGEDSVGGGGEDGGGGDGEEENIECEDYKDDLNKDATEDEEPWD